MLECLAVGIGGFIGAVSRYLMGLIIIKDTTFPFMTMMINIIGAFVIGLVVALASKYNLRIDPFKKDSDDEEIYDDSFRANFGDDKEGHYSAFKNLAQRYPEMAKKITKYQNYQAQANDRKAMEYDRRFGTQYYKRTSVEKSKPFIEVKKT